MALPDSSVADRKTTTNVVSVERLLIRFASSAALSASSPWIEARRETASRRQQHECAREPEDGCDEDRRAAPVRETAECVEHGGAPQVTSMRTSPTRPNRPASGSSSRFTVGRSGVKNSYKFIVLRVFSKKASRLVDPAPCHSSSG